MKWLGVGVINAEGADSVANPKFDDAEYFGKETWIIVIEVNRINILILLRRILGICDRAIGALGEPLFMILRPWMIWLTLECEI